MMMKKLAFLLAAILFLAACNSNSTNDKSGTDAKVYTVNELLESAQDLVDKQIAVKGIVVHVCKHGGQKMFITGEDKTNKIKINVSENISEFDVAMEGSTVEIAGVVVAELIATHKHDEGTSKEGEGHKHLKDSTQKEHDHAHQHADGEECDTDSTKEEDCAFEKENVIYTIKATSYKEVTE